MNHTPSYDSRADILAHIHQVRDRLDDFALELLRRGSVHDASKFDDAEKPAKQKSASTLDPVKDRDRGWRAVAGHLEPLAEGILRFS